jgi:hypothetical protein
VKNRYFLLQHKVLNEQGRRSNHPADEASALTTAGEEIQEVQHNGIDPFAFLDAFHEQSFFEWDVGETTDNFWN